MWTHCAVPGRPEVEKFVVEYRDRKGPNTWLVADDAFPAERRVYLFEAEMIEADKTYDFRVFAFGANEFSDAAYVSKTYKIGEFVEPTKSYDFACYLECLHPFRQSTDSWSLLISLSLTVSLGLALVSGSPVIGQRSGKSDVIPIIGGVLGAIVGIFLLGLVCFCFIHKKSGRASELDCWQLFSKIGKQHATIRSPLVVTFQERSHVQIRIPGAWNWLEYTR